MPASSGGDPRHRSPGRDLSEVLNAIWNKTYAAKFQTLSDHTRVVTSRRRKHVTARARLRNMVAPTFELAEFEQMHVGGCCFGGLRLFADFLYENVFFF